jgi:hypothetical protein
MNPNPAPPPKSKPAAKPAAATPAPTAKRFVLDSKNLRLLLLAALALSVVLFIATFVLGSSILSSESQKMVDLKVKSQTAQTQLDNLEKAKKQVDKYSFFKQVAATVIPSDKDQADDIVEINKMADQAGIAIQSITFPPSSLGLGAAGLPVASSSSATNATASKTISQAKPVTGIPGLYSLELDIAPESDTNTPPSKLITYDKMLDFLSRIENNRHTAQISKVEIQPTGASASSNKGFSFSLSINVFIKP